MSSSPSAAGPTSTSLLFDVSGRMCPLLPGSSSLARTRERRSRGKSTGGVTATNEEEEWKQSASDACDNIDAEEESDDGASRRRKRVATQKRVRVLTAEVVMLELLLRTLQESHEAWVVFNPEQATFCYQNASFLTRATWRSKCNSYFLLN